MTYIVETRYLLAYLNRYINLGASEKLTAGNIRDEISISAYAA